MVDILYVFIAVLTSQGWETIKFWVVLSFSTYEKYEMLLTPSHTPTLTHKHTHNPNAWCLNIFRKFPKMWQTIWFYLMLVNSYINVNFFEISSIPLYRINVLTVKAPEPRIYF